MRSGPSAATTSCSDAPPAKAHRRAIGHERDHVLDRLGPRQQPAGPRHLSGLAAKAAHRVPAEFGARGGLRGRGRGGELRNVAVVRHRAATPAAGRAARSAGRRGDRGRPARCRRQGRSVPPGRARHAARTAARDRSRSPDRSRRRARRGARRTTRGSLADRAPAAMCRRRCVSPRHRCGTASTRHGVRLRRAPRESFSVLRPAVRR